MAIQSTNKVAPKPMSLGRQIGIWLDNTMLLGHEVRWYITGWRGGLIALIGAALFPVILMNFPDNQQTLLVSAISAGIYVLLALGLNIVVGFAGLLDLGYVAFFVIGSYTVAVGTGGIIENSAGKVVHFTPLPFWYMIPAGALIAGIFGVLLGAPTLRLRGDYLAIVTLGFGEIVPVVFNNLAYFFGSFGITALPPPPISTPLGVVDFGDVSDRTPFYYLLLALIVLVIILVIALRDSSLGRAWVAIREDETAAAASGINLVRTKLLAFGLGATLGGLGGVLHGVFLTHIEPGDFTFSVSITVLVMLVLGGIGSVPGVIVGAIILTFFDVYVLNQINSTVRGSSLTQSGSPLHFLATFDFNTTKFLIYGVLLLVIILLRPQGLIPNVRRQRELAGIGVSAEAFSVVGALESEEAGMALSGSGSDNVTQYSGAGSDAAGRDE